jgi:hypothetical protein
MLMTISNQKSSSLYTTIWFFQHRLGPVGPQQTEHFGKRVFGREMERGRWEGSLGANWIAEHGEEVGERDGEPSRSPTFGALSRKLGRYPTVGAPPINWIEGFSRLTDRRGPSPINWHMADAECRFPNLHRTYHGLAATRLDMKKAQLCCYCCCVQVDHPLRQQQCDHFET